MQETATALSTALMLGESLLAPAAPDDAWGTTRRPAHATVDGKWPVTVVQSKIIQTVVTNIPMQGPRHGG